MSASAKPSPLRRIAAELAALANTATDERPVDPYDLRVIARKIEAQAEMKEAGL